MRREITSAGTVSGRAALSYGGAALSSPIHDGRRYTTYSPGGTEVWLRRHPLFTSGLTSIMGGLRHEGEWRSVGADSEVITARKDLNATAFGPGWTLRTHPSRAGKPAAILLHRFVSAWLASIKLPLLYLFPAVASADFNGWSIIETQRGNFLFDRRPYDVPLGFVDHKRTEHFDVATDGSLVFRDTDKDQVFRVPSERFLVLVKGLGEPYGDEPTAGEVWYLWQLKRNFEKQQARGIEQAIKGTPLFDANDLTDPGATEGELAIAEEKLRQALEIIAARVEESGILVTVGGLKYQEIVPAGKASDWLDLLKGINDAIRRIIIGETLTAKDSSSTGNRAEGDNARVSRLDRVRTYGGPPEAAVQDLIRQTVELNFPTADPLDIPELKLRALHPVSIEYVNAFMALRGARLDGLWLADTYDLQLPHGTDALTLEGGGTPSPPSAGADPLATSSDPRHLPGTGTTEGPQLSRLPARAALRSRAEQIIQEDAEAIEAGAEAIEAEGAEDLERALSTRMRELRDAVRQTADPESGGPKA